MLHNIYIPNKCYSFQLFIRPEKMYHDFHKKKINIDNNNNSLLSTKSVY